MLVLISVTRPVEQVDAMSHFSFHTSPGAAVSTCGVFVGLEECASLGGQIRKSCFLPPGRHSSQRSRAHSLLTLLVASSLWVSLQRGGGL